MLKFFLNLRDKIFSDLLCEIIKCNYFLYKEFIQQEKRIEKSIIHPLTLRNLWRFSREYCIVPEYNDYDILLVPRNVNSADNRKLIELKGMPLEGGRGNALSNHNFEIGKDVLSLTNQEEFDRALLLFFYHQDSKKRRRCDDEDCLSNVTSNILVGVILYYLEMGLKRKKKNAQILVMRKWRSVVKKQLKEKACLDFTELKEYLEKPGFVNYDNISNATKTRALNMFENKLSCYRFNLLINDIIRQLASSLIWNSLNIKGSKFKFISSVISFTKGFCF